MTKKASICGFSILLGLFILIVIIPGDMMAAPCKPCSSWGTIKLCNSPNPPKCCDCTKDIIVDGVMTIMGIFNVTIELYHESSIQKIGRYLDKALRIEDGCGCNEDVDLNSLTADPQFK